MSLGSEPPAAWAPPRGCAGRCRLGLSSLELMISMALLAIVMMGVIAGMRSTFVAQEFASEREQATAVSTRLVERMNTIDWSELMGEGSVTWTQPRYQLDATGAPDQTPLTEADLIAAGILDGPTGLRGLRVWIEYYRTLASVPVLSNIDSDDGLMERWDGTLEAHVPRSYDGETDFDDPANLAQCRYTGSLAAIRGQLLSVRVLVTWDLADQAGQRGRLSKFLIRQEVDDE